MSLIYDFGNSLSWELLYSNTYTAEPVPLRELREYFPIPDTILPIIVQSPIIAIYALSTSDPGTWRYGGRIRQRVNTGIAFGGVYDGIVSERRFNLRRVNVLQFDPLVNGYALELIIPYWLRDIGFSIWEYVGLIEDTTETQLDDIETKIDQLL